MQRSEKELRKIAEHVAGYLPEDEADAERVCVLAMKLKRWEDATTDDDPDESAEAEISVFRRK